jgi:hypothetical protein
MRVLALIFLMSCDDDFLTPPSGGGDTDLPAGSGWCAVQSIFHNECFNCHDATALGDLDLETDPYAALVDHAAAQDASLTLVVPGDPAVSFLYAKLTGTQTAGGDMPPGGPLGAAKVEIVRAWIADGATDVCDGPIDTSGGGGGNFHADGFADPAQHGHDAKYQVLACVECHGGDLSGNGPAVSCDTCHAPGWRSDCTFCHGDPSEGSGAPPVHISGADDGAAASFVPHLTHVQATDVKRALDCSECHSKPTDVLSLGHLFLGDTTPGRAEATFSAGLSDGAQWDGNGSCSNLYCHGNGRGDNGVIADTRTDLTCHDCHPDRSSGRAGWGTMSGEHERHMRVDDGGPVQCTECHGATVNAAMAITGLALHVNGTPDVQTVPTITRSGAVGAARCTGSCHGEAHSNRSW